MNIFKKIYAKILISEKLKEIKGSKISHIIDIDYNRMKIKICVIDKKNRHYDIWLDDSLLFNYIKEKYDYIPDTYTNTNKKIISCLDTFRFECVQISPNNMQIQGIYSVDIKDVVDYRLQTFENLYNDFISDEFRVLIKCICKEYIDCPIKILNEKLNELIEVYNKYHDIPLSQIFINNLIKDGKLSNK